MSEPTPGPRRVGQLVWAPDEVTAGIGSQVQPQVGRGRRALQTGLAAFLLTWVPTLFILLAATFAVPSLTDDAGAGRVALWALLIAVLFAVTAAVSTLWSNPDRAGEEPSGLVVALRVARGAVLTGVGAGAVLAWQGLSVRQAVTLAVILALILRVLPVVAARTLQRRRGPEQEPPAASTP
ncbi:hypothetical protein [Micromonospora sp. NPDC049900]|uniref:hypothetical protein n=1 Tax=unclassified Micromonospora TaxID=2617518 RepID=UPI003791349C